eukprot:5524703-Amphidinium_carterae.1
MLSLHREAASYQSKPSARLTLFWAQETPADDTIGEDDDFIGSAPARESGTLQKHIVMVTRLQLGTV